MSKALMMHSEKDKTALMISMVAPPDWYVHWIYTELAYLLAGFPFVFQKRDVALRRNISH